MERAGPDDPLLHDLRYLPYVPLIYVAWSDGELPRAQLERVRTLATGELAPGIDEQPVLARWLDPDDPPTATELLRLLRRVRQGAQRMTPSERAGLAELGCGLVEQPLPEVARAVAELEAAIAALPHEAARELMGEPRKVPSQEVEPEFDRGALTRLLDGKHHAARNQVRSLLEAGAFQRPDPGQSKEAYREQVLGWVRTLAQHGIGELAYPEVTGAAEDLGAFIATFEALADFDLSLVVKFGVQFGLFGGALYFLGGERHRALLPQVAAAELLGCFAMTEKGHGSNVRALETTATFGGERWRIHSPSESATKRYIGNAAQHGRLAVVFAQLVIGEDSYGVHPFLVPIRDEKGEAMPGVRIADTGHKMGLNGVDNGDLRFTDVRIPRENLLDRYAQVDADGVYHSEIASPTKRFFTMIGTLVAGRIAVASASVGAARSALAIAIRYGNRRRQFGPAGATEIPILDYTTHQLRLMPPLAEAIALTFALRELADDFAASEAAEAREVEARAAGLKAVASWFATATIQTSRECCGGEGYMSENRFADLKADSDIFTTFEGDNTVLMQLAAKGQLSAFSDQMSDARFTGLMRYLADRAGASLSELDPVTSRLTGSEHLRDPAFQQGVLEHRRERLLWSSAGRLRNRIKEGMDSFDAANEIQDHLVSLARAWVESEVYAAFVRAVEGADASLKPVLADLRDLYGLDRIWADQSWFLRNDVIKGSKARAIRSERRALCRAVRARAGAIVDAFAIPDAALGAPIAT